jgi:hypothetical protein
VDDRPLDPGVGCVRRNPPRCADRMPRRRAPLRRFAPQSAVLAAGDGPGIAGRGHRLRADSRTRRSPCAATRLAQWSVARRRLPRLCGQHGEPRIRRWARALDAVGDCTADDRDVRRSRVVALPSPADFRRLHPAWLAGAAPDGAGQGAAASAQSGGADVRWRGALSGGKRRAAGVVLRRQADSGSFLCAPRRLSRNNPTCSAINA